MWLIVHATNSTTNNLIFNTNSSILNIKVLETNIDDNNCNTLVVLGVGRTIAIALADSGREKSFLTLLLFLINLTSPDVEFSI